VGESICEDVTVDFVVIDGDGCGDSELLGLLLGDELNETSGDDDSLPIFVNEPAGEGVCVDSVDTVGDNPADTDADKLSIGDILASTVFVDNTDDDAFALADTPVVADCVAAFDTLTDVEGEGDNDA